MNTVKIALAALTLCLFCALAAGCRQGQVDPSSVIKSSFIDARDGKEYRTVKIGGVTWMAENLNFVADSSWCYDNDDDNCEKYGRLYSWDAAMGACPAGWRLPSRDEWDGLVRTVGKKRNAGKKLKSTIGWNMVFRHHLCDEEKDEKKIFPATATVRTITVFRQCPAVTAEEITLSMT